mmetsp:Transcript_16810/g.25433  ORF Transcript_16810/g.25433 Transcript_16810/m.25433 type:complete len:101 (+) Transcript_16810:2-304(+)
MFGTKYDLSHIRAVKNEKHDRFLEENDLFGYYVSARTGDNVHPAFYRIAADLAGVTLTRPELEVAQKPTKAELINHLQNDPEYQAANATDIGKGKRCTIM